jgi:glycosyltransferase involved in cell wall biosynthesis
VSEANARRLRYLLVTHIPFSRDAAGNIVLDSLWALDLRGLAASSDWEVHVCAPEIAAESARGWGPGSTIITAQENLIFTGFPAIQSRRDGWRWFSIRRILRQQVRQADLVHTSNCFPPYVGLSYAHRYATATGKKTVFVIAEDFYDMLDWEWVRVAGSVREAAHRKAKLDRLDRAVRASALTASITFMHTPAAVARYRCSALRGLAIRQPAHEAEDVVSLEALDARCRRTALGEPLRLVAACRHKPLKGLDLFLQAISLLRSRGVPVSATLYGDGEQTAALKDLAVVLGVGGCVTFPGSLPPGAAVYKAIAEGDIFMMPHRSTDFGRAFFDAMAGGAPVVAFQSLASVGTVRHEIDGLLCPMDDVAALADAIASFDRDRDLLVRCARNARARALLDTRSAWYTLRSQWTRSMLEDGHAHG